MLLVSLKHLVSLRLGGCKQSSVAGRTYTGGLDNLQSRLELKHSCHAQEFLLPWSCMFTPSPRETVMGESPPSSQRCRWEHKTDSGFGVDAREWGVSWGLITPLRMPGLLPHDLCHGQSSSRWPLALGNLAIGTVQHCFRILLHFWCY